MKLAPARPGLLVNASPLAAIVRYIYTCTRCWMGKQCFSKVPNDAYARSSCWVPELLVELGSYLDIMKHTSGLPQITNHDIAICSTCSLSHLASLLLESGLTALKHVSVTLSRTTLTDTRRSVVDRHMQACKIRSRITSVRPQTRQCHMSHTQTHTYARSRFQVWSSAARQKSAKPHNNISLCLSDVCSSQQQK